MMAVAKKKKKSLSDIFGDSLIRAEDINMGVREAWSTGIPFIDIVTGIGGLPKGLMVENYGPPSSGKTTLFLRAAARAQQEGYKVAYIDYENTFDGPWAKKMGIDLTSVDADGEPNFFLAVPETLEEGFEIMNELVDDDRFALIIVDSIAAMTPAKQLEPDFNLDRAGMYKAKQLRALIQVLNAKKARARNNVTTICFVNHEYDVISPTGAGGTQQPGGKALKYFAAMRIAFKQIKKQNSVTTNAVDGSKENRQVAAHIRVDVVKNKVAAPFKRTEFVCREGVGIDVMGSILELAASKGFFRAAGSGHFYIPDEITGTGEVHKNGEPQLRAYFEDTPNVYKKIEKMVMDAITAEAPLDGEMQNEDDEPDFVAGIEDIA